MLRELVVVSGKGGTGKTSIAASLAYLAKDKVLVDADVDAANLHLLLDVKSTKRESFMAGFMPEIDGELCTKCNLCQKLCRFDAIKEGVIVDELNCEGCGVCAFNCPNNAINMVEREAGEWLISKTKQGTLVHAELGIAIENSGRLVSKVRQEAKKIAQKEGKNLLIIDGPPGIGCAAIASLTGTNMVLAVVEPTLSGMHDLKRLNTLVQRFSLPIFVCINKADLSFENVREIEVWCLDNKIEVLAKIPYHESFGMAIKQGKTVAETGDDFLKNLIKGLLEKITIKIKELDKI